ncbi:hypothetical protein BGZ49_005567 [Haplosporangium sp. Z 27]|nr:hypothetical protein BGZ49_005567 [Haplosporangium sp. Z 27]
MLARTGLKYPSKLHCEKVASFLSDEARSEAIILAKGTVTKTRDNTDAELEFRQESNFLYLTGVMEEDFYFIYHFSHNRSYLIAPDLDPVKAIWKGPTPTDKELLRKYDVDYVVRYSKLLDLLKHELKPRKIHGWGQPENVHPLEDKALEHELKHYISHRLVHQKDDHKANLGFIHRPHEHGPYGDHNGHRCGHYRHHHGIHKGHKPEEVTLFQALILARINKTPIEIALSRESTRITSDAHRLIMKSARPGLFEYQLEALFRYECGRQGAKAQAYLPIVGTGVNGAYLHYTRNDTQIKSGDLILIDAACEADCYGSDITRTFPANGRFSSEQADIYNLVLEMQTSVIRSMGKGVDWREMNSLSQKIGIRGLKRVGILKGDDQDLYESNVIKVFYPHGLGHLLGLNVHDDGLGLSVQRPPNTVDILNKMNLPVEFHDVSGHNTEQLIDLPPPSSRRNKALGSSLYATPSTILEPGMLLTVEPGIYFNPAQIEFALNNPSISQYFDEPVLRRYMSVGGVRIEDVVLVLPDGTIDNITTAPKGLREVEEIVQEGQREYLERQQMNPESGLPEKKYLKNQALTDSNENNSCSSGGSTKERASVKKRVDGSDFLGHRPNVEGVFQAYEWQTYAKIQERVTNFGAGLFHLGLAPGHNFGIYSVNRPEWTISEIAGYMYNYISVPLYDTLGVDSTKFIINQTEMHLVIASIDNACTILNMKEYLPGIKTIVVMDDVDEALRTKGNEKEVSIIFWDEVERNGRDNPITADHPNEDDIATICYTSGTTGIPKGAVLTHKNFIASLGSFHMMARHGKFFLPTNADLHISYLPLAHVFERICQAFMISGAARIGYYQGDTLKLLDDIVVLKPTFFVSVPRLFNRIYDRVSAGVKAKGGLAAFLYNHAFAVKKANLKLGTVNHAIWDKLVFGAIRARLGGNVKNIVSASAPISPDVMDFLRICFSANVFEGYGQTEQATGLSITFLGDMTPGQVGPPQLCAEVKLRDVPSMNYTSQDKPFPRGEILLRGPTVFKGYYKAPELTAETLDIDGWSSTGDVGQWDAQGRLMVIDRVKNIFKLSQGEYIAPEKIESILSKHPLVAQVFVYGNSLQSTLVGVIVPDAETLLPWANKNGLSGKTFEDLCSTTLVHKTLLNELSDFGRDFDLKGFEILKNIYVTPEQFTIDNDLLTPTFKLKRHAAKEKYGAVLEQLYKDGHQ